MASAIVGSRLGCGWTWADVKMMVVDERLQEENLGNDKPFMLTYCLHNPRRVTSVSRAGRRREGADLQAECCEIRLSPSSDSQ